MKLPSLVPSALLAAVFAAASLAAADSKAAPTDAELIAKARSSYPLKTCLVSGEPLGSMGEAAAHVHRVAGKPARVIFVCCEGCIDDFKGDPDKFLKKVDDAAKGKTAAPKTSDKPGDKSAHKH